MSDRVRDPCTHPDPRPVNISQPDGAKWCRLCGALYVTDSLLAGLFGKSGGWIHPILDYTAPTIANLIREERDKNDGDDTD